ncbi:pyridine nucleotide-disulfide oxidoreductase/dicluster-binding protein [Humidesulfovibrio sp.]
MDQQTLRQWESRCIQEEPPFCQGACPLRLDGRALCGFAARGDFDGARKLLERTLPLPRVVGRVCEGPCEAFCKRGEVGEPVSIAKLERAALTFGSPGPKPLRLPGKGGRAVILGVGLSALVCAWDLLKKGWGVRLLTLGQPLGGALRSLPPELLPPQALDEELAVLKALGLELDEAPGQGGEALQRALSEGPGVLLEWGFAPDTDALFPPRDGVDPVTLAAPESLGAGLGTGLFLAGWPDSPGGTMRRIDAAADGRRAASSLDRLLAGASLTAMRDKEGATGTRLFTSLKGVEPRARIVPAIFDYDEAKATREGERCLDCQCLECVKVCPYLEQHKGHPRAYARQIYNNAAIVKGQHLANRLVNSCSLCGLCAKVCPKGFDMGALCLAARQDMVASGTMPQAAHEFALEDMAAANAPDAAFAQADPATGTAGHLFFPGCQLAAAHQGQALATYAHLRQHMTGGVGLISRCCGIPAQWAGRADLLRRAAEEFASAWISLGRPRVIAACSGCLSALRLPEYAEAAPGLQAVSLWEVLEGLPLPDGIAPVPVGPLALHDPCTAREDAPFREAARTLAARLGLRVEEPEFGGELAECCGFGGLMAQVDAPLARDVAARTASHSPHPRLATCAMCRHRLAATGKPALHLLDFLFPRAGGNASCPGAPDSGPSGPGPSLAYRPEARAAFRTMALAEVWDERHAPSPGGPVLRIPDELLPLLEQRRILAADLREAVARALEQGRVIRDEESGRLLCSHRPRRVTFWAEFEPEGEGYVLRNAWSHRMVVPGAGGVDRAEDQGQPPTGRADQTYAPEGGHRRCACTDHTMQAAPVTVSYLGATFEISLLACPACGQTLVPEPLALGRMAEVEALLEDK